LEFGIWCFIILCLINILQATSYKLQANSMSNKYIKIRGARVHNLKNVSLDIPRDKLVVLTGISGSGKIAAAVKTPILFAVLTCMR